jgi:hypothetical protein
MQSIHRRSRRHQQTERATPQWLTGLDSRSLNRVSEQFGQPYN